MTVTKHYTQYLNMLRAKYTVVDKNNLYGARKNNLYGARKNNLYGAREDINDLINDILELYKLADISITELERLRIGIIDILGLHLDSQPTVSVEKLRMLLDVYK